MGEQKKIQFPLKDIVYIVILVFGLGGMWTMTGSQAKAGDERSQANEKKIIRLEESMKGMEKAFEKQSQSLNDLTIRLDRLLNSRFTHVPTG